MPVGPYDPTPMAQPVLPPRSRRCVCPWCGKPLPEVALPAGGTEALVSKAPARLAETVRVEKKP